MSDQTTIPEGYELAEHSTAKDIVRNALEEELQRQGVADVEDGGPDLLDLASVSVGALLAAGVTIPEGLTDPNGR